MPEWLVLALAMSASCAVVLTIMVLRQQRLGEDEDTTKTPDVIEYITMMIGVVYAIVLGLAIAGVWEQRSAATDWVEQEAQSLHEISKRAQVYPDRVRDRIRSDVDTYVAHTVRTEWSEMSDSGELTDGETSCSTGCARTSPVSNRAPRWSRTPTRGWWTR